MAQKSDSYTLITGASKGIGKAMAYECAKRGHNLLLVARSADLLEQVAADLKQHNVTVLTYAVDLFKTEAAEQVFAFATQQGIEITMLLNNAGMGFYGKFDEKPLQKHLEVMHLNMESVIKMAHAFLNHAPKNKRRYIMNTASTGAFQPVPYMAVYCATKSFVLSFTRALRHEVNKDNVYVTALCPGGTESEFFGPAQMEEVIKKNAQFMMPASVVARVGIDAVLKNQSVAVPGFINKLSHVAVKLFPHDIVVPMAAKFF
jgi:short-subunit dehydrogenase